MRPEDLRLGDGSELPPRDVASLGSKKICDPEALAQFERLKKEAQRQCEQIGVRFLGGYAVPEERIDPVVAALDRISEQFARCKRDFLDRYDRVILDWIDRHPDFADAIRRAVSPVDEVARRLQFDYAVYRMRPVDEAGQLDSKVNGMGHTLFREVARDAAELFERSVAGRQQISQRALNPLRRMRDKLDGLSFLDHRVQPTVTAMDDLFVRLPRTGPITGALFHELMATILILADPDKMKRHGEGQLDIRHVLPTQPEGLSDPMAIPEPAINPERPVPSRPTPSPQPQPSSFYF